MKRLAALLALCGLLFTWITPSRAATNDTTTKYQQLTQNIVTHVLKPKAGQVVVIMGGPENIDAMEYLATELRKNGAFGIIAYGSNRMQRMYYDEVPTQYDSQAPRDTQSLLRIADALVVFDNPNDPSVTAGVPAERLNALNKAFVAAFDTLYKRNIPLIDVGNGLYPSAVTAQQFGITNDQLTTMFWNALTADYGQLHVGGQLMQKALAGARSIHVTAPNGTDVTFSAIGSKLYANDGTISSADRVAGGRALEKFLPAGDVSLIPAPGSANGKIVFGNVYFNNVLVTAMTVEVKNGKVTSMKASTGNDDVQQFYATGGEGRDLFSYAAFGINPGLQYIEGSSMFVSQAAGMVTLGFGGNYWNGGSNRSVFNFSGYVPHATVSVDGKLVASDGKLTSIVTQK